MKVILLITWWSIKNRYEICLFKYRKRKTFFLQAKNMQLKIHKLLRMTYNGIKWILWSRAWWLSKCLVKEKGVTFPKYTTIIKRRSEKWNLEWPALLSLGCQVIVNIYIINASIVKTRCLCCLDWRCSQIFRNSFGKNYPRLNIYICSLLMKRKNEHLKERKIKNAYLCQPRTKKQIIKLRNIHIFLYYFIPPLGSCRQIYRVWKCSPDGFIFQSHLPSTLDILTAIDLKG